MKIQEFLRNGGTLADLLEKYAIKSRRHSKHPELVLLKYNQIDSPFGEQIVEECRGLILSEADNWNAVCVPFFKFYNAGEGHAAPIDWSTARVYEKLDGSLCALYHYKGEWHVATSGTPDALGEVNGAGITFADLFWRTFKQFDRGGLDGLAENMNIMFELMCPENRVVVRHHEPNVVLIGGRDRTTLEEYAPNELAHFDWPCVRDFPLQTLADIEATFASMDPLNQEGYVICDANFNRIKVKHPGYVAIHHMYGGLSNKAVLEIVRTGEYSEVLKYYPEYTQRIMDVKEKFEALKYELLTKYNEINHIESQKEFAQHAKTTRCPDFLFKYRAGHTASVSAYLAEVRLDRLCDTLDLKGEDGTDE